jgi:hypothetical protein
MYLHIHRCIMNCVGYGWSVSDGLLLVPLLSRPCVSRSGTTTSEENYRLVGILLDKEAPNKESMVEADEVRR